MDTSSSMEKIVSLCKRRGFIFPGSEIYGGLSNSWDYGPLGVELKNSIKQAWWARFVHRRDDMTGIDAALIMNPRVWEASGHLSAGFADPLIECKKCHDRFRADHLLEARGKEWKVEKDAIDALLAEEKESYVQDIFGECPHCRAKRQFALPRQFNLMLKTHLGPAEDKADAAYFRPETAQAMFVDFKNVLQTMRMKPPFGIAQVGKAFRNEITPGNFIFRTREFEQMEIEYFIPAPAREEEWQDYFEMWRKQMWEWMTDTLGLDPAKIHELEVPAQELAHYSKRTIDFEYEFPFGKKELYGLAYRYDFDLKNHSAASGEKLVFRDPQTNEEYTPHVIEPTWGVDRSVLAVLSNAYREDGNRVWLSLKPSLAPYKAAVFPLLANKEDLVKAARELYGELRSEYLIAWDDRGNIGKRYFSQDEIGTPFCITVDFQTLEDKTVTIRDRDTLQQQRLHISEIAEFLRKKVRA